METLLHSLRWVAAAALLAVALWVAALNWSVAWRGLVLRRHAPSWIPLLAGVAGAVGLLLLPLEGVAGYWWVPFVIDWGSAPGLLHTAIWHAARKRRE